MGHGEDLGFYPQGGESPGGLWPEEGQDLTQVLTGALWLIQGRQTVEGAGRAGGGDRGTRVEV